LSYENGEPFVFDKLPGGSPTRSLLAVCGVHGSLGEDAMPVMHGDAAALCDTELGVVQALYAEMPVFNYESWAVQVEPVLDAPTFHDDSVYTGTP
jgi:anthranilate/para-aminobenzoate synthase component II